MSQYNQGDQGWVQPADTSGWSQEGSQGRERNQEPWSSQQGGQTGQEPWSSQPGSGGYQGGVSGGGVLDPAVHAVRQNVQSQINGLIDHYANQVPGGHMLAPEAKQALSGVLDNLQRQMEAQVQSRVSGVGGVGGGLGGKVAGGLFGENPSNPGGQGGQL